MSNQPEASISPLLRVPLEIRFAIYEELLAPHEKKLHSERVLCNCRRCKARSSVKSSAANPNKRQRAIFPAILGTNKMIHDEAMVILYGKNRFQLVCPEISTSPSNKRIPEMCGVNSLVHSEVTMRNDYLKDVALTFSCYARDELDSLPFMWSWIEPMILAAYPNLERISINLLRVNVPYRVFLVMARKHEERKPQPRVCADRYFETIKMRQSDSNWEMKGLCDTILPAQHPGLFDGSSFAIRSIQWSDSRKSRNLEKLTRGVSFE